MGTNYHNEVLRKARVLERKRQANSLASHSAESLPGDMERSMAVIQDLRNRASAEEGFTAGGGSHSFADPGGPGGVARNRQAHDHSRNGPLRDDTRRVMNYDMKGLLGPKPNYLHTHWKG